MAFSLAGLFGAGDNYSVQNPYSQQALADALSQTQGVQSNEGNLARILMAQAQGQGPNPALSQLKQTTQQNIQNASGILASDRGLNPALAARMAAQNAATANQNAAGQAATLSAEQQLGATGQLTGLYGNMANQGLGQQQLINSANLGAEGINAGAAAQNSQTSGQIVGGLLQGGGAAASKIAGFAKGGFIPGRAQVPGDSKRNDTVPIEASPGEIIIPRSHAKDPEMAKEFIDELMKRKKAKSDSGEGFGKVLEAHRKLTAALEEMKKGKKSA